MKVIESRFLIFVFLTNDNKIGGQTVAKPIKAGWYVEIFFKWINQHVPLVETWGYTAIYISIKTYKK